MNRSRRGTSRIVLAAWVAATLGAFASGAERSKEPEVVTVQHILISFKGKSSKPVTRKRAEAETLAKSLLARAQKGEDFDALVKQYTDDQYPGIYKITNDGAPITSGATPRDRMAMSFGDVSFSLAVGEIGFARYDGYRSPYGWHVIKRLE